MNEINISLDNVGYKSKPNNDEAAKISSRIGSKSKSISYKYIYNYMEVIGKCGLTFCPATFNNGTRKKSNFEQMQLLVLDFDNNDPNKLITYDDVIDRAEYNELPVLFAYETLTSQDRDRFRIVFLNDVPIADIRAAEIALSALISIFPEADKSCKDVSKMYYGGKRVLKLDYTIPTIDIESIIRSMTLNLKERYGDTHYKRKIKEFAIENNIALNKHNLLDISREEENQTEESGAFQCGKNMPNPFIIINGFGENLPNYQYRINLHTKSTNSSVKTNNKYTRTTYRSDVITDIGSICQLYREYETGSRLLDHAELYGLATNLIQIESGSVRFKEILVGNNYFSDIKRKYDRWDNHLKYFTQSNYKPQNCISYCPYNNECSHGKNILSTIRPRLPIRVHDYIDNFGSLKNIEDELDHMLEIANNAEDQKIHVIKAPTAIGKSRSIINLMKNSDKRILVGTPTNGLKNELYDRMRDNGINGYISPSLRELGLPKDLEKDIDKLYATGRYRFVVPYIKKKINENDEFYSTDLAEYLKDLDKFDNSCGNAITTHKKILYMNEEQIMKYNNVIIDEDIIIKSMIPDHISISLAKMDKILDQIPTNSKLAKKIKIAQKCAKDQSFIELPEIEYNEDEYDGISVAVDIPAFCKATKFYLRKASDENNLLEDTKSKDSLVFIRPIDLKKNIKYIITSATADENIFKYVFGEERVIFNETKTGEYIGKLIQYPSKSMGRSCINKDITVFSRIVELTKVIDIITFLIYNKGPLHFGNTDGRDMYKGKNINIIGTPHQPEWIYKLFAFTYGLDYDLEARLIPNMMIEHNGWRFPFFTYEDPILRNIQFWFIESELEQAVGRARILREPCTVYLFSNFPLRQAQMREVDY